MSKSKNDTDCMGGTKRFYVRPARDQKGQQDAIYQLIDPKREPRTQMRRLWQRLKSARRNSRPWQR